MSASLKRTCAFDATDLQRAAAASSAASPLRLPPSPTSPTHLASPAAPASPSSKKRVAFCPTTTVFLFERRLDGGKIPSDAAAPLGLGQLQATVVWPLLTEEAVCPYTRRRPGAAPVPPADRFALLKAADTADESLDETLAENMRLLQELSDSRFDLMLERAGHSRASTDEAEEADEDEDEDEDAEEGATAVGILRGVAEAADAGGAHHLEEGAEEEEEEDGEVGERPAKRVRLDGAPRMPLTSASPLTVIVPHCRGEAAMIAAS